MVILQGDWAVGPASVEMSGLGTEEKELLAGEAGSWRAAGSNVTSAALQRWLGVLLPCDSS